MSLSPASTKTSVNTGLLTVFETVIGAFLEEPNPTLLKVLLAPFFLWVAGNMSVNVNSGDCFPASGKEWRRGFVLEGVHGLV